MIKKIFVLLFVIFSLTFATDNIDKDRYIYKIYSELNLENKIKYEIFQKAYKGYEKIQDKREGLLTIIDFTKPSNEERFFVLDLQNKKINYSTYVTHGKNSGLIVPLNFSNNRNSYMSSLGFYITGEAYEGTYGYSLRLKGLEEGFNSNAFRRAIVVHGADYADPSFIEKYGFLGRSEGCPAVPTTISKDIIDSIKGKTVLFIMGNDKHYIEKSRYASL